MNFICGVNDKEYANAGVCKWPTNRITYAVTGYIPEFTQDEYRQSVRQAFDSWQKVCGIIADEVNTTDANLILSVGRGRRMNFDGPSGTLAWCEIPCGNVRQCRLMMDLDENWTRKNEPGQIFVVNVLAHEIGHGLGIYHINQGKALMNPVYSPNVSAPLDLDEKQAVLRYGKPKPVEVPAPKDDTPGTGRHKVQLFVDDKLEWTSYVG